MAEVNQKAGEEINGIEDIKGFQDLDVDSSELQNVTPSGFGSKIKLDV